MSTEQIGQVTAQLASLSYVRGDVTEIKRRLALLEALVERIDQLEVKLGEFARVPDKDAPDKEQSIAELVMKARTPPLHGLQEHFECEECGSNQLVAARIKCTDCGHKAWYGWWTDKGSEE